MFYYQKFAGNQGRLMKEAFTKPKVIVLDVYETMLDMSGMERRVNQLTDSKRGYVIWFELIMQNCFADNSLDAFHDFLSIAKASLQMTGLKLGRTISDTEADELLEVLKHLPVKEEVQPALSRLNDSGYDIIALTNAPENVVCERMERTGLISYFDQVLSAEAVRKYKPEKKVYHWAADKLSMSTSEMLMASAHGWDVAGAANAGMKTAFLNNDKQTVYPFTLKPDLVCKNLTGLVDQLEQLE
jgi:2-haloacid dehalogenase